MQIRNTHICYNRVSHTHTLTAVAEECDVYVVADGDQPHGVAHEISHEPFGVDHHNV